MSESPRGWIEVPISEVLDLNDHGKPFQQGWSPQCHSYPAPQGVWGALKTTAIQQGQFWPQENKALPDHLKPRPHIEVKAGDILMTCAGPRSRCGVACLVEKTPPRLMMSGKMYRFRTNREVMQPKYLMYFLLAHSTTLKIDRMKTGISDSGLNLTHDRFATLEVPLAPPTEQLRIVAKIEELFSELDQGVEALTTAREQLKAYRQSVLKHAFDGKITKGWRIKRGESSTRPQQLQEQLGAKAALKVALHETRQIPEEWEYFPVDSLCSVVRGGSPRPAGDPKYYDGPIPFLKVADLTRSTGMKLSAHSFSIKPSGLSKTRLTQPNTLLISNSGATLGVPKICTFQTTFNDGIAAFLGIPDGYLEYFYFFWESQTASLRNIDQGAAQPNLNTSILGETLIPMCSKEEAAEIVSLLKATLSNIEQQFAEMDRQLEGADALRQSILKQAFSGKLVAQDPSDEPASELLKRIRAERANASANKPQRKTKKSRKVKEATR